MKDNKIEWRFITPRAPWQGFWEKLIGIFKASFKIVVGKALLTDTKLETLVVQIESKLNDRPITYVSSSLDDPQPLTPSMLLYGNQLRAFPDELDGEALSDLNFKDREYLSKSFIHLNKVLKDFWRRWHND